MTEGAHNTERDARLLAARFGLEFVELGVVRVPGDVLVVAPRAMAVRHRLMQLGREGMSRRVAISDPLDPDGVDNIGQRRKQTAGPS